MPGHCRAGIKAMEARYRKYMKYGNKTAAEEYLLSEVDDTSKYFSVQLFADNAINPCLDSTYKFILHIMKSFVDMHADIQALEIYNFGADEVAHGAWENSQACKTLFQSSPELNTVADLKQYFGSTVAKMAASFGLDVGAWEDGLMNSTQIPFHISVFPR